MLGTLTLSLRNTCDFSFLFSELNQAKEAQAAAAAGGAGPRVLGHRPQGGRPAARVLRGRPVSPARLRLRMALCRAVSARGDPAGFRLRLRPVCGQTALSARDSVKGGGVTTWV